MNEQANPTSPHHSEPAAPCCSTAPARPAAEAVHAQASPCCGTAEGAEAAGACCDPNAKREAATAGAGCC
ncbi:hypothetical protein LG634_08860 [Streptomyces bambusae]|uniref:hypothetical protein n=1 Tax=Streptomyces bambusae TaxID=1550616 RepID=UPI001CFD6D39|nr:hypothetical protein [Streptomyces bambusae]MCB5164937.1 hypothetical protein [Streptomyces bambusae]